jgi:hypothetical protein
VSEFRPHVKANAMPPTIRDENMMAGAIMADPKWWQWRKKFGKKRALREFHEWKIANDPEYAKQAASMRERYDLIVKAEQEGILGWEKDVDHYRDGSPYCKCPASDGHVAGTVDAHNARYEACLESVNDGR